MRIISKRIFSIAPFVLGAFAASLAACGGSGATIGSSPIGTGSTSPGTGVGGGASPTATATATAGNPTGTPTALASASAAPSPVVSGAIYHPAANGDTFAFAGTLTTTYARPDQFPSPEPTQTAFETVNQAITVTNPATFAGNTAAVDFHNVETDAQTMPAPQTTTDTTDAYFAFSNSIVTGNFNELGFTSTLDNGYTVTVTYGAGNGLVDILPERAGTTWSNSPAMTSSASAPDGTTARETVDADGTYTEHFVYPNVDAVTDTGDATSALDGSGTYATQNEGTLDGSPQTYTLTAPSAPTTSGTITETTSVAPSPDASGATPTVTTTSIPNWIPTGYLGVALATETDMDNGSATVPAACALPTSFGTTANQIVRTKNRLDALFGEFESETVTTYDSQTIGPVCTVLNDVTTDYYDFSGQSVETKETVNFEGTPQQITTLAETLGLQSETLQAIARRPEAARSIARSALAMRLTFAESHVVAAREIRHLKGLRALAGHTKRGARR